ncbi:50S ribosomal protein L30 [Haloactinomyces albus]|uniref:Large ribosomal subunit protein uL30 n=1 Tax=Haloactinomyces albus TaxID=1352928 RepID=A0AAE3ZGB9_9ACTN|nr:50S ribosomal protein L30 [Haloactinomyces albus]MDR7302489.1 large subunit ribosomal protein L30 [Haloactinomyces albus]
MSQLKITQVRGLAGAQHHQKASMRSLGLRRIHQSVVRPDDPNVRGMVNSVHHLVTVEEVE